jgi:hypothetical protein
VFFCKFGYKPWILKSSGFFSWGYLIRLTNYPKKNAGFVKDPAFLAKQ